MRPPAGFAAAGSLPVVRRELFDPLVGDCGQSLQHVFEIGAGSMSCIRQFSTSVYITALRYPASSEVKNNQFFLPSAVGRMAFSRLLLFSSTSPWSRNRSSISHWLGRS